MGKAQCDACGKPISDCKDHYTVLNLRYVPNTQANEIRAAAAMAGKPMVAFVVDTVMDAIKRTAAA